MKIHSAFTLQVATATIPSLILLLVVPVIRSRLGLDAFAGFSVIVAAVGFLSILDGGLGRTITYFVSVARSKGVLSQEQVSVISGMAVGVGFSIVMMLASSVLLQLLDGKSFMTARNAIFILLFFCPAFVAGSILKGALEGQQRFALSAALQLTHGAFIGIAPLIVINHAEDLSQYALIIGAARISLMLALFYATGLFTKVSWRLLRSAGMQINYIFHYSKWLFFSNIVGLCIIFSDRFAIAGYFDSIIVAAYVLPMELIARGQLLVSAFSSVIFPKLVAHVQRARGHDFAALLNNAQGLVVAVNLAIGFVCVPLMEPLMSWWLGSTLAPQAATIALVGIVGLTLVSSSSISMLAINGLGHTRQVAILHGIELPLYLGLLYFATIHASLQMLLGAWLLRLLIDAFGMQVILHSLVQPTSTRTYFYSDKKVLHWVLLTALAFTLLVLIFRRPFISIQSLLYWSLTGAACSIAVLVTFSLRLRAAISTQQSMSYPTS